jgi:hypothetical protein
MYLGAFIKQGDSMALNLTTRADYKAYAGIKSTNYDAEIDALIPKVSALVKNYCRKSFVDYWDVPLTEIYDGQTKVFLLKETPVVAVQSVTYSTDYGVTNTALVQNTDYVVRGDNIISTATDGFKYLLNGYRVTYTAGYEDVPNDVELAIMDLITYYRQNDSAVHSTKAPGTNSVQIEYISTTNLPAHIKRVLDLHVADYT